MTRLFLLCFLLVLLAALSPAAPAAEATAPTATAADRAASPVGLEQAATGERTYRSVEERRLVEALAEGEHSSLARQRQDLENRKIELKRLEAEVDKKLDQLGQLRLRIEQLLKQKDEAEQQRAAELAKMYEKMSAEKAAAVLASLDQELAIAILGRMKTKSAARILNSMERDRAAQLSTAFSTLDDP